MKQAIDVITVSRQIGSGGTELAQELSARLGIPLFDKDLLSRLAAEMKTSEEIVAVYERMRYEPQKFVLTPLAKRYTFLEKELIGSEAYVESLGRIMRRLASLGRVIILGRGGQCTLRDRPRTLHLRIVADLQRRLADVAARPDYAALPEKKIARLVARRDAVRGRFTRTVFGRDINDPLLYHLVINLGLLDRDRAVDMIVDLVGK